MEPLAGIASSKIDIEKLKREHAENSAAKTTEKQQSSRVAQDSKTDFSIAGYYGGISTEAKAQQDSDALQLALAEQRDFTGRESEDPANQTAATKQADINKHIQVQYNFYNPEGPEAIKRQLQEKAAATAIA